MKETNIILIGFMGCGKTTVGRALAKTLQYEFQDTDQLIVNDCKKSINAIFAEEGEGYFRNLETSLIQNLIGKLNNTILSVGGGLPIREGNAQLLQQLGQVIYLKTSKDTIQKRLRGDTSRPLLAGDDADQKMSKLLEVRTPIYESAAHHIIGTDSKSIETIIKEIQEKTGCN